MAPKVNNNTRNKKLFEESEYDLIEDIRELEGHTWDVKNLFCCNSYSSEYYHLFLLAGLLNIGANP